MNIFRRKNQKGFTLVEIVVATAIFAGTVTLLLGMFTSALRINRKVQGLRQVAQGTRHFTETFTREIRNGRVDYASNDSQCSASNYGSSGNQSLGVVNFAGEEICFYYDNSDGEGLLRMRKRLEGSNTVDDVVNPNNFKIRPETFRFIVRPTTDPAPESPPFNGTQPSVTILAEFEVTVNPSEPPTVIPYQTTISTDIYDIPHQQ